jgi:predicted site-specific integrase-resolvase
MKLSQWAKLQGVCYHTAWRWFHDGLIKEQTTQLSTGTILVYPEKHKQEIKETHIYARVSSNEKKKDLISQAALCEQFCMSSGWPVSSVVKEIASGMNDNRPKLNKLLEMKAIRLVVLHKDRLTRFGFNYLNRIIESRNGEICVINSTDNNHEDLLKDFIAIITSFCCRLYGARRGQAKAIKLKDNL